MVVFVRAIACLCVFVCRVVLILCVFACGSLCDAIWFVFVVVLCLCLRCDCVVR